MRILQSCRLLTLFAFVCGCAVASNEHNPGDSTALAAGACSPSAPCPSGRSCVDGQCQTQPVHLSNDATASSGGSGATNSCVDLDVAFENQRATVLLLVDQSGSMFDQRYPPGAATTRWSVLHSALMDPTAGAVKSMESAVRIGLSLYTAHANPSDTACPHLTNVPIALGNHAAIDAAYSSATRGEDTPTGDAINAAVASLSHEPDPKYLLLATDGDPDTCADPNPGSPQALAAAQAHSIEAVQAAFAAKIKVIVMSVAKDIAATHLQGLANAGAGKDPATTGNDAAPYYVSSDNPAELTRQLTGILSAVRTCKFTLMGKVAPGAAASGTVALDGQALTLDDANGYRLNGASELEIQGAACEKVKTNGQALKVSFPCGAFEPH